jgi:hypothetical protein
MAIATVKTRRRRCNRYERPPRAHFGRNAVLGNHPTYCVPRPTAPLLATENSSSPRARRRTPCRPYLRYTRPVNCSQISVKMAKWLRVWKGITRDGAQMITKKWAGGAGWGAGRAGGPWPAIFSARTEMRLGKRSVILPTALRSSTEPNNATPTSQPGNNTKLGSDFDRRHRHPFTNQPALLDRTQTLDTRDNAPTRTLLSDSR